MQVLRQFHILIFVFLVTIALKAQSSVSAVGTNGTLTVTTETASVSGEKGNVLAVWVENSQEKLINTLMYYTGNVNSTAAELSSWWMRIGSFVNRGNSTTVDVISGATQYKYPSRSCYWGKNTSLSSIPDGKYTVYLELADGRTTGTNAAATGHELVSYTFTKGPFASSGELVNHELLLLR